MIQQDWETWIECSTDPAACDPAARLTEVRTTTGAYYTDNVAQLRQWAAQGVIVRQPDGLPDNNFVVTESVVVAPNGTTATALTCTGDGRARYQPPAGGGAPVLVPGSDAHHSVWTTTAGAMKYRYMWQHCEGEPGGQLVWALIADPVNMALGAYDHLLEFVPEPIGTFQPLDADNGWAYVQVATDFRLPAWDPVTVRVVAGPFWASATATPRVLSFQPGDPGRPGDVATCGAGAPVAAFNPGAPGDCSYTYLNSSAPAGGRFAYTFVLTWDVTFDSNVGPPLAPRVLQTDHTDTLAVAEARPVVLSN